MKKYIEYFFVTIILFIAEVGMACSCPPEKFQKQINEIDAIIEGQIISKESRPYENEFKFEVKKVFKGETITDTILIYTGKGIGDCGYHFELNKFYILYAMHYNTIDGKIGPNIIKSMNAFYTDICYRTKPTSVEEKELIEKNLK